MRDGTSRRIQILIPYLCNISITLSFLSACSPYLINEDIQATPSPSPLLKYSTPTLQSPTAPQNSDNTPTPTEGEVGEEGIPIEQDQLIPPIPPHQLQLYRFDESVDLRWQGSGSDIIVHYVIYRKLSNDENWEVIGIISVQDENMGEYTYQDLGTMEGIAYEYAISAVDHYENESRLSETVVLKSNPSVAFAGEPNHSPDR